MTKERVHPNGEAANDLAAAIIANAARFHKEASRLYGDVGHLHTKVEATPLEADRLHRKIEGTHARIRIFRSQNRVHCRGMAAVCRPTDTKLPSNRIDAIFPAVMIRTGEAHGPSRSRPHRFE